MIDHRNKFITIIYKYNDRNIYWKDSFRIFPISLNELCDKFNVEGKKSDYNLLFNSIDMFNDINLLIISFFYIPFFILLTLLCIDFFVLFVFPTSILLCDEADNSNSFKINQERKRREEK